MDKKTALRLITIYGSYRELWDSRCKEYYNKKLREELWDEITKNFNLPKHILKAKYTNLASTYRGERSREKSSVYSKSGAKRQSAYKSKWFAYDAFNFLNEHSYIVARSPTSAAASSNYATESRSGESSDNNEEEEVEEEEEQTEDREQQVIIKQEPSTSETSEKQPSAPAQPRKRGRRKMFPRSKLTQPMKRKQLRGHDALDNKLLEALKILKKSDLSRKKDECDSFGEYIAISLRKHDERTQSMIKQAINNILFEQEMRMYSVGQYTVVLTGDDENPLVCEEK